MRAHIKKIKYRITGPLWGEFTGDRWIPRKRASKAEKASFDDVVMLIFLLQDLTPTCFICQQYWLYQNGGPAASPVTSEFPTQWIPHTKASEESCDVFFDLRLNQQLSKQWRRWWFETPSGSLYDFTQGPMTLILGEQVKEGNYVDRVHNI